METVQHVVGVVVLSQRWLTAAGAARGWKTRRMSGRWSSMSVEQSPMRVCGREEPRKAVWVETGFVLLACVVPLIFVSVARRQPAPEAA